MKYSNRIEAVTIFEKEKVNDMVKILEGFIRKLKRRVNAYINYI